VATRDLRLSANVTYLDSHYVSFPDAPNPLYSRTAAGELRASLLFPIPNPVPGSNDLSASRRHMRLDGAAT